MEKYVNLLLGSKLIYITRTCDIVMLGFESRIDKKTVCLNISGDMRILDRDELIISYFDMHGPGRKYTGQLYKFKYDEPGQSFFDDQVEDNYDKIMNLKVEDVKFRNKDLFITLDKHIRIEVTAYTLVSDQEFYRLFIDDDLESHFVVGNP